METRIANKRLLLIYQKGEKEISWWATSLDDLKRKIEAKLPKGHVVLKLLPQLKVGLALQIRDNEQLLLAESRPLFAKDIRQIPRFVEAYWLNLNNYIGLRDSCRTVLSSIVQTTGVSYAQALDEMIRTFPSPNQLRPGNPSYDRFIAQGGDPTQVQANCIAQHQALLNVAREKLPLIKSDAEFHQETATLMQTRNLVAKVRSIWGKIAKGTCPNPEQVNWMAPLKPKDRMRLLKILSTKSLDKAAVEIQQVALENSARYALWGIYDPEWVVSMAISFHVLRLFQASSSLPAVQ